MKKTVFAEETFLAWEPSEIYSQGVIWETLMGIFRLKKKETGLP